MRSSHPTPSGSPAGERLLRQTGLLLAGPAAAGVVIGVAVLARQPLHGAAQICVHALALTPALLVHCHRNANRFGLADTVLLAALAGFAAYILMIFGLIAGAGATLLLAVAVQTGVLTAANEISGIISLLVVLRSRASTP
jgi:hypothetical protein